jgi:hypothetical protein
MSGRFGQILEEAALLREPEVQFVNLPRPTLQSEAEIDKWAEEAKDDLKRCLANGPVIPR